MFAIFAWRDAQHACKSGSHLLLVAEAAGFGDSRYPVCRFLQLPARGVDPNGLDRFSRACGPGSRFERPRRVVGSHHSNLRKAAVDEQFSSGDVAAVIGC
jgi:hypothetical protein